MHKYEPHATSRKLKVGSGAGIGQQVTLVPMFTGAVCRGSETKFSHFFEMQQ